MDNASKDRGLAIERPPLSADLSNLPWIQTSLGAIEVRAPGSVYEPILLKSDQPNIKVRPGELDEHEEQFVRDLIGHLYPQGAQQWNAETPMKWGEREIWFKRNVEKQKNSFRLRVDDSDWYYPDFILWIIDRAARIQTFGFVDPKGLRQGNDQGWGDHKVVSTVYIPHVLERKLGVHGAKAICEGEEWTFRIRGALVSNASYADLAQQAKFFVHDKHHKLVLPSLEDYRHGRIVFQEQRSEYIGHLLNLLTQDTALDQVLDRVAAMFHAGDNFVPADETDYALLIRRYELGMAIGEADLVKDLVCDFLKLRSPDQIAALLRDRAVEKLVRHLGEGVLHASGIDSAPTLISHPTPCEILWKQLQA